MGATFYVDWATHTEGPCPQNYTHLIILRRIWFTHLISLSPPHCYSSAGKPSTRAALVFSWVIGFTVHQLFPFHGDTDRCRNFISTSLSLSWLCTFFSLCSFDLVSNMWDRWLYLRNLICTSGCKSASRVEKTFGSAGMSAKFPCDYWQGQPKHGKFICQYDKYRCDCIWYYKGKNLSTVAPKKNQRHVKKSRFDADFSQTYCYAATSSPAWE